MYGEGREAGSGKLSSSGAMRIRIFNHYQNLPIAILAVIETLLILAAPIVVETLFYGRALSDVVLSWRELAPKILAFVASTGVALTAMGLYSARQRARTRTNPRPVA